MQTGFGRTGRMFAIDHWDVVPDIMTMAKGIANGTPIGVFTTGDTIASSYTRPGASTTGGNPVSATAALATINVIEKQQLTWKAKELGGYFKENLTELQAWHTSIGEVRGKGLMIGVELVKEDKIPATEEVDFILEELKNRGILAGKTGMSRNVITFQPPLVITRNDIDHVVETLDKVLFMVESRQNNGYQQFWTDYCRG